MLLDNKSEKGFGSSLPGHTVAPGAAAKGSSSWRRSVGLAAAAIVLLTLQSSALEQFYTRSASNSIISWRACPDVSETDCAYLTVPMDYTNPKPNETVSLALRKLPATAPVKDRLGSLFINPGGPGGSGTSLVLRAGTQLSVIVEGRFDIISWDPRGVNLTSPPLDCFETAGDSERFVHDLNHIGLPYEARGDATFSGNESSAAEMAWTYKMEAFQRSLNGACEARGNQLLLRSASTAFVVKDMVSILDALGESKLNYWGFSYGTILGATFSAMFPDKVGRVVLDGVSSAALYTTNMFEWGRSGMDDTHKTYQGFIDSCAESGPKGCALATSNSTSAKDIGERIDALRSSLRSRPVSVPKSKVGPGILTTSDIQYAIFSALYAPKNWPKLAEALAALEKGDGFLLYELVNASNGALARKDPLDNVFHRSMESSTASTAAIMCSDSDESATEDATTEEVAAYYRELSRKSITGEIWAAWVTTCRQWRFKALETYRGPWTVADGFRKTDFPLLFISMSADPVTPLSAAKSMSRGFGNDSATLLIQNGFGHCSSAHPSLCTAKVARDYILHGVVPEYGTTCDADKGFLFPHPDAAVVQQLSVEDERLAQALDSLSGEIRSMSMTPPSLTRA